MGWHHGALTYCSRERGCGAGLGLWALVSNCVSLFLVSSPAVTCGHFSLWDLVSHWTCFEPCSCS